MAQREENDRKIESDMRRRQFTKTTMTINFPPDKKKYTEIFHKMLKEEELAIKEQNKPTGFFGLFSWGSKKN